MEPERLIIELVRDRLRAAYEEWAGAMADQSHAGAVQAMQPSEEHKEMHRHLVVATQTARYAVEGWERALTVALDRLMK